MVRQEEEPETGKITVLLDVRSSVYSPEGFERAVTAALSVLVATRNDSSVVRFVTTASSTATEMITQADLNRIDERLALISPTNSASLASRLDELCRKGRGSTAIVITGSIDDASESALNYARQRLAHCIVISAETPTDKASPLIGVYDTDTDLRALWSHLLPLASQA